MEKTVPNREAMSHHPATIVRPTEIQHFQQCVRGALKRQVDLTVLGGGHSDHCWWPNIVAVNMSAFNKIQLLAAGNSDRPRSNSSPKAIVGAGFTTRDVVSATMQRGLTVPLGSHHRLGAGTWLQGGMGHLGLGVVDWVIAEKSLAFEAYGADLRPDPRDAKLVVKAFRPTHGRIAPLKHKSGPHNVLTYAFQLSRQRNLPTLIVLVTDESGAEKDHCAKIWTSKLTSSTQKSCPQSALAM